jgi:hypothetical protein
MKNIVYLTKLTVDFEICEEDIVTILTDKNTHEDMKNKYDGEEFVTVILNCKRATEYVQQNNTRLPSEVDFLQLYKILSEGVPSVTNLGNYRTFLSSFRVRRLFEKRVHGGMNEAEIIKLIKSIFKARPFWVYNEAVCKLLMDWLYDYHKLKPNYDLEEVHFGKFLNKLV